MILLSSIIKTFQDEFLSEYRGQILPSQLKALGVMKHCRTSASLQMLVKCDECDNKIIVPHSCGHRNCPHCQNHESQRWLDNQLKKQVPAEYFLITFTLPAELRSLAWDNQRILYTIIIQCAWKTLVKFSLNDKQLQGIPGAIAVLHTHSRRLAYHPHVHFVVPAAAIDPSKRLWRTKTAKKKKHSYLFNHNALANVFQAKVLAAINKASFVMPAKYPRKWVVDCKSVGSGEKALIYLGRYLYKGVIQEKDIIGCENGQVTFQYFDSKTRKFKKRTLPGVKFLRLLLSHVLPRGFRRARNFGFLHPNSKHSITLLQYLIGFDRNRTASLVKKRPTIICRCCGATMSIIETQIEPVIPRTRALAPIVLTAGLTC